MPAPPSDESLMADLQDGDPAAYEELYQRWKGPIFHFLVRRTGSHQAAEEALQETWLRVYRFRGSWQRGRKLSSWLYAIAANAGRDAREVDTTAFELDPGANSRPEVRDYLVRALHALAPEDRRVLLLVSEGFESPEVAEMLGISASAVRMRLKRAREQVLETLGALDG